MYGTEREVPPLVTRGNNEIEESYRTGYQTDIQIENILCTTHLLLAEIEHYSTRNFRDLGYISLSYNTNIEHYS